MYHVLSFYYLFLYFRNILVNFYIIIIEMNKIEKIVEERTHTITEHNKLHNEIR